MPDHTVLIYHDNDGGPSRIVCDCNNFDRNVLRGEAYSLAIKHITVAHNYKGGVREAKT